MSSSPTSLERANSAFEDLYGHPAPFVTRAPGRVNLIGEHTDYNDGFVLPMALPFDTVIAAQPLDGRVVRATSEGFGTTECNLDDNPQVTSGWGKYLHGMGWVLGTDGHHAGGWEGTVATDIPAGASLSSSAALEMAAGMLFLAMNQQKMDPSVLARYGQRVENEVFGLPSGILDQLASAASQAGCASLIDCRNLSMQAAPLAPGTTVVIMDTGTRRELVDSEYQDRQQTCAAAAERLGLAALRDATLEDLQRLSDPTRLARARHVVTENTRTLQAAEAMEAGDGTTLGQLMRSSHASLRDDYQVSGPALDAIVELANNTGGCLGARMTGGGFAGCAVALVETKAVADFCATITRDFVAPEAQPPTEPTRLYPVQPHAGASVVRTPYPIDK